MTRAATGERRAPSARGLALAALVAVESGERANRAVACLLEAARMERRDRDLVTELVYGTCRMQRACDWATGQLLTARGGLGGLEPQVRAALRCGAYQLLYTRIPSHAAVSATVEEVQGPGRRLANAVLRRLADRVAAGGLEWPDLPTELSYPDWIVERLSADLGAEEAGAALEAMNRSQAVTMRSDGYAQDLASQLVAACVGARPGERILDACAAPGGKATAMAASGALVVAGEPDRQRAALLSRTAKRFSASVLPIMADGAPPWRGGVFDRVLVDAPCSGLGALRRRPDARWRVKPSDPGRLASLQRRLLTASSAVVRPGGLLVYSVCTITHEETVEVDSFAARALPGWEAAPIPGPPWRPLGRGALLLPQDLGTDGMYLLSLVAPGRR